MPIQFSCPYCRKQTTVADQFAGQSGPCAGCGKNVTVPLGGAVSYPGPTAQAAGGGAGVVLLVMGIVLIAGVVLCGGGILLVSFPVMGRVRQSAQRANSQNNLKQLGIAIHNYHDVYGQLPPAVVKDASGQPLYSGIVLLLPYLEHDNLYQQFDKSKAWNDPANIDISRQMIVTLMNPGSTNTMPGHSDYMLVGGTNAMLSDNGKSSIANVIDGTSNTIMAVEVGSTNSMESWAKPVSWDPTQPFDSPDPTMVNVLFGDGSVRAMPKTTMVQTLRLLSDRQDGQVINLP
jgi:prepilin-type processing-associated H-X9-DG protein